MKRKEDESPFVHFVNDMFCNFEVFNRGVKKFLGKAGNDKRNNVSYIKERLKEIEEDKVAIIKTIEEELGQHILTTGEQDKIRFRLRVFSTLHRLYMSNDESVGEYYKNIYCKNTNNQANINNVLDTQYIALAMLQEPGVNVIAQLRFIIEQVYSDPSIAKDAHLGAYFRGIENGIIGHAGVHALFAERGNWVTYPPAILDAEHGVDLIAIDKKNFLQTVEQLNLPNGQVKKLVDDVGSYNSKKNCGRWFQEVAKFPVLAQYVTLVQIKTHSKNKNLDSNIQVDKNYLLDSIEVTNKMFKEDVSYHDILKSGTNLTLQISGKAADGSVISELNITEGTVGDAVFDFIKMRKVLPGAALSFIDIHVNAAMVMIKRRAGKK